ncbi:ATP-binding protein [Micromonospora sp. NPDC000089]|uniref:ATP-binding protein n=1 Tax=unclassified Micromonospora TaxID=2617518 RepID=UPI0036B865F5
MTPATWTILRDFRRGTTRITIGPGLTPEAQPRLAALLAGASLDAPLTLVVDLDALTTSDAAPVATLLARWAVARADGPQLMVSANPLTPTGRLLRATLGRYAVLGVADDLTGQRPADPRRAHICLPADRQSPAAARRLVAGHCAEWGVAAVADRAMVVASELVSNAVQHAGSEIDMTVTARAGSLRISVRDRVSDSPRPGAPAPISEGGRGLPIVAALATEWGYFAFGDGKTVWADLDDTDD